MKMLIAGFKNILKGFEDMFSSFSSRPRRKFTKPKPIVFKSKGLEEDARKLGSDWKK